MNWVQGANLLGSYDLEEPAGPRRKRDSMWFPAKPWGHGMGKAGSVTWKTACSRKGPLFERLAKPSLCGFLLFICRSSRPA